MKRPTVIVERIIAAITLSIAFLVMASVLVPAPSIAEDHAQPPPSSGGHAGSEDPHAGLRSLGALEQHGCVMSIYATSQGPRYSIHDAEGQELAVLLSAEQVAQYFPDLRVPATDFSAPADAQQFMLAPPETRGW